MALTIIPFTKNNTRPESSRIWGVKKKPCRAVPCRGIRFDASLPPQAPDKNALHAEILIALRRFKTLDAVACT